MTMSQTLEELRNIAIPIIQQAAEEGANADDTKMNMFASKVPYSKINSLYKNISIELGLMVDPKQVTEGINSKIKSIDWSAYKSWDDVITVLNQVEQATPGATASRVLTLVRAYTKEEEIKLPEKPRATGGTGPRSSKLSSTIVDMITKNPSTSKIEAYKVIHGLVGGANRHKNTLFYVNTTFAICSAVANGVSLVDAVSSLKAQEDPEDPEIGVVDEIVGLDPVLDEEVVEEELL